MSSVGRLTDGLFNFDDSQIAAALGIEMQGDLRDLRYLPFINEVRQELEELKETFEATLQEELSRTRNQEEKQLYEDMKQVAAAVASNSVHEAVRKYVAEKGPMWNSQINGVAKPSVAEKDNHLEVAVNLSVYTGNRRYGQSRSDARTMRDLLEGKYLGQISFDSVGELSLVKEGYARITALASAPMMQGKVPLPSSHVVDALYKVNIPLGLLPQIYAQHKQVISYQRR